MCRDSASTDQRHSGRRRLDAAISSHLRRVESPVALELPRTTTDESRSLSRKAPNRDVR